MALSNFLIRPPADQSAVQPTAQTATPRAVNGSVKTPSGADFAVLMDKETENKAVPRAALPTALPQDAERAMGGSAGSTLQLRNPVLAGRSPSDILRAQAFNKAQADMRQTQAMEGLMQSLPGGNSPLDLARNMGMARQLRSLTGGFDSRLRGLSMGDFIHTANTAKTRAQSEPSRPAGSGLGRLSARFESGGDGIAAIGYDRNGGTSYGKYQIASRVGSMDSFLKFLDNEAPDLSRRLRAAGPPNTGGRRGAMPDAWRAIAGEQAERFEALQEAFIHESHYKPAVEAITQRTGLEADKLSPAMQEVIWSTAVQHGPAGAARIFDRADTMSGKPADPAYERKLISNVYALRANQFGSSTSEVRAAVGNRFRQEKTLALNMLNGGADNALA